jgi:hypothetical protein
MKLLLLSKGMSSLRLPNKTVSSSKKMPAGQQIHDRQQWPPQLVASSSNGDALVAELLLQQPPPLEGSHSSPAVQRHHCSEATPDNWPNSQCPPTTKGPSDCPTDRICCRDSCQPVPVPCRVNKEYSIHRDGVVRTDCQQDHHIESMQADPTQVPHFAVQKKLQ